MITHTIEAHQSLIKLKPRVANGSQEHRQIIYERTLEAICNTNEFDPGTEVYAKTVSGVGVIIDHVKYDEVAWDGLKVLLIEVWWYDAQDSFLHHPSDLKPVYIMGKR